jgi:hypothetical protein
MVGALGRLEILQVTRHACGTGQLVIIVDVALTALNRGMETGERPASAGVIERRSQPG